MAYFIQSAAQVMSSPLLLISQSHSFPLSETRECCLSWRPLSTTTLGNDRRLNVLAIKFGKQFLQEVGAAWVPPAEDTLSHYEQTALLTEGKKQQNLTISVICLDSETCYSWNTQQEGWSRSNAPENEDLWSLLGCATRRRRQEKVNQYTSQKYLIFISVKCSDSSLKHIWPRHTECLQQGRSLLSNRAQRWWPEVGWGQWPGLAANLGPLGTCWLQVWCGCSRAKGRPRRSPGISLGTGPGLGQRPPGWLPVLFLPMLYLSMLPGPGSWHYRFGPGTIFHLFKSVKDSLAYGWFCSPCNWAGLITSTEVRAVWKQMFSSYLGEEKVNKQGKFWKRRISRYLLIHSIDKDLLGSYICQSN